MELNERGDEHQKCPTDDGIIGHNIGLPHNEIVLGDIAVMALVQDTETK